ncbi:MAG: efflux RND transporter permease subunit [Candidatus Cyclobacteriaceae bacterium M2_1C_046]
MWTFLSHNIIKYRLILVIFLAAVTLVMGYYATKVQMSYDFAKTVPSTDPAMQNFQEFKDLFGEDGNVIAIAVKDSSLYELSKFKRFRALSENLEEIEGINSVLSLPLVKRLVKDPLEKKFNVESIFTDEIESQQELDSLLSVAKEQVFYSGQIINPENGATLILIAIDRKVLNSENRIELTNQIIEKGEEFSEATGIDAHYAGLPFVRSIVAGRVKAEMQMFLLLSVLVTAVILLLFFRSFTAVIFPMVVIGVVVIWAVGSIALFGFKITLLTGLIPPVIVVIGIPNSVYLLNKYHQEFEQHGNKVMAISRVIRKIGLATFITNCTTAVGFLVLVSTDITILREFGVVAGINVLATFIVSIILIPAVFYWLPAPSGKQLKHLQFRTLDKALNGMDQMVHTRRPAIYAITTIIVMVSIVGALKINAISFMVDDLPEDSPIQKDLAFFEENFSGIMPLELVIDTGRPRGVLVLQNLEKVEELEEYLGDQPDISEPVSLVSFVKASKQAFYNNSPSYYSLPTNRERAFILRYLMNQNDTTGLFTSFVDTTLQKMRVSLQVADIGSDKMENLIDDVIQPKIDTVFADTDIDIIITGTTPLFIKGNKFLIENLRVSLILAFIIIAIIMAILFRSKRMIAISLIPNIIPLLITAGIMGYAGIPLKPSTALIFSIVFGISVDDSIHFLAKYRQELFANKFFVAVAISKSIRETGASMIYTSIILFAGFVIFAWSDFGGTVALGILTSTTLLIAMITNLVLLPSLLLSFDDGKRSKDEHPLIEQYDDGFYQETEDEEINIDKIKVKKEE